MSAIKLLSDVFVNNQQERILSTLQVVITGCSDRGCEYLNTILLTSLKKVQGDEGK